MWKVVLEHARFGAKAVTDSRRARWLMIPVLMAAALAGMTARPATAATACNPSVTFTIPQLCADDISAVAGIAFTGQIATYAYACGETVTVDWGDGTATSTATPSCTTGAHGGFDGTYSASHTYASPGSYTVTLTAPSAKDLLGVNQYPVQVTASVRAPQADLSVTMNGPSTAKPNSTVVYTVVVASSGPEAAPNAILTLALSAGESYQALTAPAGWTCAHPSVGSSGGTISCTTPSFASGGSSATSLGIKVKPKGSKAAPLIAVAAVRSDIDDPQSSNNSATVTTTVTK